MNIGNDCKSCGHYELKKMISSGKPYGYSGDIACLRCSRFSQMEDLHTKNFFISPESDTEQARREV